MGVQSEAGNRGCKTSAPGNFFSFLSQLNPNHFGAGTNRQARVGEYSSKRHTKADTCSYGRQTTSRDEDATARDVKQPALMPPANVFGVLPRENYGGLQATAALMLPPFH